MTLYSKGWSWDPEWEHCWVVPLWRSLSVLILQAYLLGDSWVVAHILNSQLYGRNPCLFRSTESWEKRANCPGAHLPLLVLLESLNDFRPALSFFGSYGSVEGCSSKSFIAGAFKARQISLGVFAQAQKWIFQWQSCLGLAEFASIIPSCLKFLNYSFSKE